MTKTVAEIVAEAMNAGKFAGEAMEAKIGDRDACGFAWVMVKPARGKLVNELKSRGIGYKCEIGYRIPVYAFFTPNGQSITVRECAANAFVKHLRENGFPNVYPESRID